MFEFRSYQKPIVKKGSETLRRLGILLLAMEVRTGKTLTAFGIAQQVGAKKVLFITRKKVILSKTIQNDHELLNPDFALELINYESVHKANLEGVDLVVVDESHALGAFPKPSARTKKIKEIVSDKNLILLSGTPTPESFSQIFHQFWISMRTPFPENNFYHWSKNYVNVTKKTIGFGSVVNDYSDANEKLIREVAGEYMISLTQKQAGFESGTQEYIMTVPMKEVVWKLSNYLKLHKVFVGKDGGEILADTPVKMMQKLHQLHSGSILLEDKTFRIIDHSKAEAIKKKFEGKKIGIYYKFRAELQMLKDVFKDQLTENIDEFNNSDKNIALQIVSGREGISLKKADFIVFLNIDFSSTSYWQARARMQTKDRTENKIFWCFSDLGMERKVYSVVKNKKDFTLYYFKKSEKSAIKV